MPLVPKAISAFGKNNVKRVAQADPTPLIPDGKGKNRLFDPDSLATYTSPRPAPTNPTRVKIMVLDQIRREGVGKQSDPRARVKKLARAAELAQKQQARTKTGKNIKGRSALPPGM